MLSGQFMIKVNQKKKRLSKRKSGPVFTRAALLHLAYRKLRATSYCSTAS